MKTKEQKAADIYSDGRDCVMRGGNSLRSLARHITVAVNGNTEYEGPLWRERAWPDQTIRLDKFEDYLLKPAREGLGISSLLWLKRVLDAHEDDAEKQAAFAAVRQEIADFDARVEQERAKASVKVDAAKPHGGTGANQYSKDKSREGISLSAKRKDGGSKSPERIIARLKRDASDNPKAGELLEQISSGEIKPFKAAKAMGYVKAPDPVAIVEKQRDKLEPDEQVRIWEEWGRALPDEAIDRVEIAKEAYRNLTPDEVLTFMEWANNQAWSSAA